MYQGHSCKLVMLSAEFTMALRCVRQLAKQTRADPRVWEEAFAWQDRAYEAWQVELGRTGTVAKLATVPPCAELDASVICPSRVIDHPAYPQIRCAG